MNDAVQRVLALECDLIDAVNDARTDAGHREAEARLRGFRAALEILLPHRPWWHADYHTAARYGCPMDDGRDVDDPDSGPPTCIGVRLDWTPDGYERWSEPVGGEA